MPTIAQIETNLLNATKTGNATLLSQTLAAITDAQVGQINAGPLSASLSNLAMLANPSTAAAMTRAFMVELGSRVDGGMLISTAEMFAMTKNYAALDALTDNLTMANKTYPNGNGLALGAADYVVRELAHNDDPGLATDNVAIANAVRDFMTKLGAYVSGGVIIESAEIFAMTKNYGALDALTDNLVANNKKYANGNSLALGAADYVVRELAHNDDPGLATDNTAIANALRDFMTKLGTFVSASAFIEAAEIFAMTQNYAALDALMDTITANNKKYANGNGLALGGADYIIRELAHNDAPQSASDNNVIADVVRDFMGKLGVYVSAVTLNEAAEIFAHGKNVAALDSLLGEASATQINSLNSWAKSAIANAGIKLLTSAADTWNGTAASEKVMGGAGNDTLSGKDGNDALYGDAGNDWLYGDSGNDSLSGGAGNDVLVGGVGNDSLRGGTGTNDMTGGTGADTFVFDATVVGKSTNRIADFNRSQGDKIDISDVLETADPTIANLSQFVKMTAGAGGVHTLSVDVNGAEGGANFVALATIVGVANGTTAEQLLTSGNLVV